MPHKMLFVALCLVCAGLCMGGEPAEPAEPNKGKPKEEAPKPDAPESAKPDQPERPEKAKKAEPGVIWGTVYAIDKKLSLVMIDVGSQQGVKPLQSFLICRDDGLVGYITITTVQPTASAGLIDKGRTFGAIQVGDEAMARIEKPKE